MHQKIEQSNAADDIGKNGCDGNSRNAHTKTCHQNQVQRDVEGACKHQHIKRTLGIAFAAQNGRNKVVDHGKGHSHKVNLQVKDCIVQDIGRGRNQRKDGPCKKDAHERKNDSAKERNHDRRMDATCDGTVAVLADGICDNNICPYGNADK